MFEVRKAKRQRRPLKISLEGLSGSGKTFTALRLAFALKRAGIGKKIVIADSENESAGLYDGVQMDGEKWEYEVCPIPHEKQHPAGYAECYEYLVGAGFDIVIFDSLSHAWHGAMEQVDAFARANKGDKFGGWAKITPEQRKMLTTLTDPRAHCIATMRVKSEYERIDDGGKAKIKKVGMKTDQRENTEYEFDAVIRLEVENHAARVEKVRGCTAMDGKTCDHPGPTFWKPLFDWWLSAEPVDAISPEDQHRQKLNAAKTLTDLATAWNAIPKGLQARLADDKDRRKAVLATKMKANGPAPTPVGVGAKALPGLPDDDDELFPTASRSGMSD
ncbi:Signal recognition particle 54 kDa protein [Gemmata sp. SH-PL17]|uniref:AAA+ ATPase domain-containing protein n=1 Tax=Gemmata massiliana TaxID=1210884 RepID=A0A6P2DDF4_9BACT|nr:MULTISPECIES: AAA family ATPase [Gemmata]AMV23287.1 Signal recognition particle 54 kDa protein [Gemmata sp. SH-PL17]VTS00127.1 Uncharacterized protein OS=Bacteroides cellulosilyticus CL02T12C19 GN=HMPREF1062_03091 PE=4 SV=1: SRP54 [Gemmata massiliana]